MNFEQLKSCVAIANNCNDDVNESEDKRRDGNDAKSRLLDKLSSLLSGVIFDPFHLCFCRFFLRRFDVLRHFLRRCDAFQFPKNFNQKNAERNDEAKEQPTIDQLQKLIIITEIKFFLSQKALKKTKTCFMRQFLLNRKHQRSFYLKKYFESLSYYIGHKYTSFLSFLSFFSFFYLLSLSCSDIKIPTFR